MADNMTALAIVQEASIRLGVVPPSTLFPTTSDASKFDTDAQLLLGALKQSVRNAAATAPFHELIHEYKATVVVRQESLWEQMSLPYGFDGMVSDVGYHHASFESRANMVVLPLLTYSDFLLGKARGFIVMENIMKLKGLEFRSGDAAVTVYFLMKSRNSYDVGLDDNVGYDVPQSDNDISVLPDELLIAGTVMYYKNYRGLDYQLEMKTYTDYVTHLRTSGFDPTIAMPSLYKDIDAMGMNKQQQQQPQQQQGR